MNYLTPDIQNELLKAARRSPACLLFSGANEKGKTLASEVLAVHFDAYLFRVDLQKMITQHPDKVEENLERIFSRAKESGDMLYFENADALLVGAGEAPGLGDALTFFLCQLKRYKGVIIVSLNDAGGPATGIAECFGSAIHFPAL